MANGRTQSVSMSPTSLNTLAKELAVFSRAAQILAGKIQNLIPIVGTDTWWEKEERAVDEELRQKKYREFRSVKDAIKYLQKYT